MHILIQWWSNVGTWCFRIGWEYTFTSVWDLEGWLQVSGSHYIWYTRYTNEPHYPGVSVSRAGQGVSVRTGTATQGWCAEYYSPGPHYVALCCRCELHGQCKNGTCLCVTGWNGRHCTIQGCPSMCSDHGRCTTGLASLFILLFVLLDFHWIFFRIKFWILVHLSIHIVPNFPVFLFWRLPLFGFAHLPF